MEPDAAQVIEEITNKVIIGGDISSDGCHLFLSDGKTLVIIGAVGIGLLSPETLQ